MNKPNVILITIDALRADHLGFMGYKRDITPNIDALARESIVFKNAFSVGPTTPYAFPGILASIYPADMKPDKEKCIEFKQTHKLLSEIFKEQNYTTAGFTTNPFISTFFGYNKGWDYFEELLRIGMGSGFKGAYKIMIKIFDILLKYSLKIHHEIYFFAKYIYRRWRKSISYKKPHLSARYVNEVVKAFISSVSENSFFIWIHYMDVHTPYFPFEFYIREELVLPYKIFKIHEFPYMGRYFDDNHKTRELAEKYKQAIIDLYDAGIRYVDLEIGNLLDFLKSKNLLNNTIICITSDHGDEFLEHGHIQHFPKLYNELLHVPLILYIPGCKPDIKEKRVSLIDLAPTLCNVAGIKESSTFKGKNMLFSSNETTFHQSIEIAPLDSGEPKIEQCRLACQFENYKYIKHYGSGKEELYNLSLDPAEQNDISQANKEILAKARDLVIKFELENPLLQK